MLNIEIISVVSEIGEFEHRQKSTLTDSLAIRPLIVTKPGSKSQPSQIYATIQIKT